MASVSAPIEVLGWPDARRADSTIPAKEARKPLIVHTIIFTFLILIPENCAAVSFPPTA